MQRTLLRFNLIGKKIPKPANYNLLPLKSLRVQAEKYHMGITSAHNFVIRTNIHPVNANIKMATVTNIMF